MLLQSLCAFSALRAHPCGATGRRCVELCRGYV